MALFSAFFVSAAFEHPNYPGYVFVGAGGDVTTKYFPVDGGGWFNTPGEAFDARFPNYCQDWAKCEVLSGDVVSSGENRVRYKRNVKVWQMCQHGLCNPRTTGASIELIVDETFVDKCPPPTAPSFEMGPVEIDGTKYCGKIKSHCPEPTDDDPFTFGMGEQRTVCYDNADGTQCRIETDETGGYYHPNAYGSQEPVACREPEPDPPCTGDDCDTEPPCEGADCDTTEPPCTGSDCDTNPPTTPPDDCQEGDPDCITDPPICEDDDPDCITDPPPCDPEKEDCDTVPPCDPEKEDCDTVPPCDPNQEECDPTPTCDPSKEDCENKALKLLESIEKSVTHKGTPEPFNINEAESFYESVYEEGFQGVWDERSDQLRNSEAAQFIQQFKFTASGSAPSGRICFNLGSIMNYGCHDIPLPDGAILGFIKMVILISAAFLCRRIIFGG